MEEGYRERNARGVQRLTELANSLKTAQLAASLDGGWTVSAALAHLAFYDRWVQVRWDRYESSHRFDELPDSLTDLINAAALAEWLVVAPESTVAMAVDAAKAAVDRIGGLDRAAIERARETGRLAMLDRSVHWNPHLDEIEAVLRSRA